MIMKFAIYSTYNDNMLIPRDLVTSKTCRRVSYLIVSYTRYSYA